MWMNGSFAGLWRSLSLVPVLGLPNTCWVVCALSLGGVVLLALASLPQTTDAPD